MGQQVYFHNLKIAGSYPNATGTVVGSKSCLDVNVANSVPIPIVQASYDWKEYRFMDPAVTNINASAGAFVEIGDTNHAAGDVANTIEEVRVNWNGGNALVISSGADATAAALQANWIGVVGAGQTIAFGFDLASGDKIWVRALQNAAVTSGELLINLMG